MHRHLYHALSHRYLVLPACLLLCLQLATPLLAGVGSSLQPAGQRVWICTLQGLQSLLVNPQGQPIEQAPAGIAMTDCALTQLSQLFNSPPLPSAIAELTHAGARPFGIAAELTSRSSAQGAGHPIRAPPV